MPAIAPAPPKPAPAPPSPPPAPSPSPAPAPSPEPKPVPEAVKDSPFADLEKVWGEVETKPKGDTPPEKPTPEKPTPKATDTPPDKPKPFNAPKEMRDHMAKLETDLKAKDGEMGKLKSQLAALETKAKEHGTLSERITAVERERDAAQAQIRALKKEKSPEFIKQYEKPFNEAATFARQVIGQLTVLGKDGTTPVQDPKEKWDVFASIYNLPYSQAIEEAEERFGKGAQTVLNHMQELHRLDYVKTEALKEEEAQAATLSQKEEADAVRQREQIDSLWTQVNRDLVDSVDEYHDDPEDKESAEVRNKALAIYDAQPRTMKEKIVKDAHIRHMVGAHQVMKRQLKLIKAELAEAKKELEAFKNPQPGKGKRTAPAGKPEVPWEEELREAVT